MAQVRVVFDIIPTMRRLAHSTARICYVFFFCTARVEVTTTYPCFFSRYGLATGRSIDRTDTLVLVYFFQTERRLNTFTVFMLTKYRILCSLIACLTRTTQRLWKGTQRSACLCLVMVSPRLSTPVEERARNQRSVALKSCFFAILELSARILPHYHVLQHI